MTTRVNSVEEAAAAIGVTQQQELAKAELSQPVEEVVAALAKRLRSTALIAWTLFAIALVAVFPIWISGARGLFVLPVVISGYLMFVALRTQRAAFEFDQIAQTEGRDQAHLLVALVQLLELYRLKVYLVLMLFAAGLLLAFTSGAS